jgi:guanylate kinase
MLVILSGGSGVGKNTVINYLLTTGRFEILPTYTTRDKRAGESDGNPYYFISETEFLDKLAAGEFYEHEKVHNRYYGTSKKITERMNRSDKILIKDIDVLGTKNLLSKVDIDIKILTVFLYVKSKEILRERLKGRGEKDIELRLQRYEMEQAQAVDYDYMIENNDFKQTRSAVRDAVYFECGKDFLLPTKFVTELDIAKIEGYTAAFKAGKSVPPVKVTAKGGKVYITDGHCRYLASLSAGKHLAREIVFPADFTRTGRANVNRWFKLAKEYKEKSIK